MLRNVNNPHELVAVICDKLFYVEPLRREICAKLNHFKRGRLSISLNTIERQRRYISPNNCKCTILNANHKMPSLHIGNGRHVRDDIILLFTVEKVLEVLKLFPFASRVFLRIFTKEIFLKLDF